MQESGNLKITFKNDEQAAIVYPLVKEMLADYEYWCQALKLEKNVVKVEHDIHMYTDDYPGLVLEISQEIASHDVNIEFDVEANCGDDEGFYYCDEIGHFKQQTFYFESKTTTTNVPDLYEEMDDVEDYNPFDDIERMTVTKVTKGKVVDGKLIFK